MDGPRRVRRDCGRVPRPDPPYDSAGGFRDRRAHLARRCGRQRARPRPHAVAAGGGRGLRRGAGRGMADRQRGQRRAADGAGRAGALPRAVPGGRPPRPVRGQRLLPVRGVTGACDAAHRRAPQRSHRLHRAGVPVPAGARRRRRGAGPGARDVRRPGQRRARGAHERRTAGPAAAGPLRACGRGAAELPAPRRDARSPGPAAGPGHVRLGGRATVRAWGRSAAGSAWPTGASPTR